MFIQSTVSSGFSFARRSSQIHFTSELGTGDYRDNTRFLPKVLTLGCALALLVGVNSASFAQAQQCRSMQVLLGITPKHRDNVMSFIAPRLKEKLGVDLIAEEVGSTNMVERLTVQAANPRVTIAHWDVSIGLLACESGLCKPIDLSKTPNIQNLDDWIYSKSPSGEVNVLATNVIGVGLLYNTEEFKKKNIPEPTSWDDLARPELKGRITISTPTSTWGTAEIAQWAKIGGGNEMNVEPAFVRAKSLLPNVHSVFTWSSELSNLMQQGEVWLAATGSSMGPALRAKGVPVKWIAPSEGSPMVNAGVSLVKGAPCEAAAYEYLNLYYSPEFQALRIRDGGATSVVPKAWEGQADASIDLTVADFPKLTNFDWKTINVERTKWMDRWRREVK